jgi:hypothetical protein
MNVQPTEIYSELKRNEKPVSASANDELLGLVYQTGILDDKRNSPRRKVRVSVPAVPVDAAGRPVGAPFVAETRNISATGICLVHSQRIDARYLMVELPGPTQDRQEVAVEIIRTEAVEDGFELAGPFVTLA